MNIVIIIFNDSTKSRIVFIKNVFQQTRIVDKIRAYPNLIMGQHYNIQ